MEPLLNKLGLICIVCLIFMFSGCKSSIGQECETDVVTEAVGDSIEMRINDVEDIKNAIPGCVSYNFSRDCFLKDSLFNLHYEVNLALQQEKPEWFMCFLNDYIHKELSSVFFGNDVKPRIFNTNCLTSLDDMGKHYFAWMKKNYKKEFPQKTDESKYLGRDYEFRVTAYPIWESRDYITYQIYVYEMPGSMRCRERDFCRTFEKTSGRELGIKDFYSKAEFKVVITLLEQKLSSAIGIETVTADVNPESNVFASSDMVLKERYNGKYYPRPAITPNGIVFAYQTYEKASGGYGILKFTIPYDNTIKMLHSK